MQLPKKGLTQGCLHEHYSNWAKNEKMKRAQINNNRRIYKQIVVFSNDGLPPAIKRNKLLIHKSNM